MLPLAEREGYYGVQNGRALHIQILDFEGVFFDELAAGFDLVAHEDAEELVGGGDVVHRDLAERAVVGVERGVAELFGVHLAEAFEASDGEPAFAGGADGGQQPAEVLDAGGLLAAVERVARDLDAGALLANEILDVEAELFKLLERALDRADFVQLDDV